MRVIEELDVATALPLGFHSAAIADQIGNQEIGDTRSLKRAARVLLRVT